MKINDAIGGFFELELPATGKEYHSGAYRFNLARNALSAYLKAVNCKKVYLPTYCCASLANSLNKHGIEYDFYNINKYFEPLKLPILNNNNDEHFLYVNYFGVKSQAISPLLEKYGNKLIIDNSQSFFSKSSFQACNIYSARKFFGVPDGAYLYTPKDTLIEFELKSSKYSTQHLTQRIEHGPEHSYPLYRESERILKETGTAQMSLLSQRILSTINYDKVIEIRRSNFNTLHHNLSHINLLSDSLSGEFNITDQTIAPMIYPLVVENGSLLRKYLINNKIFVAKYWEDVLSNGYRSDIEEFYTENLIPLPIDQRYGTDHMLYIANTVLALYT